MLPAKGHDVLLAALAALADLDWRCTLVGPLDLDPDFVDELHKAAADTGIADRVVFAGPRRHDDLRAAYAAADAAGAAPRAPRRYGMVVTEALAHGLPVVATAVGGVPEALGQGDDGSRPGLLVPAGRPRRAGRGAAPLARGPAAPAAAAPFGRAAPADAARRGRRPPSQVAAALEAAR